LRHTGLQQIIHVIEQLHRIVFHRVHETGAIDEFTLARSERLAQDSDHARLRFEHGAHVHHFSQAGDLRPRQDFADFLRLKNHVRLGQYQVVLPVDLPRLRQCSRLSPPAKCIA
jgi:hypothetical protein